jgi:hypothetical protein
MTAPRFWTKQRIEETIIKPGLCFTGAPELDLDIPMPEVEPPREEEPLDELRVIIDFTLSEKETRDWWAWEVDNQRYVLKYLSGYFLLEKISDKHRPLITYKLVYCSHNIQTVWESSQYQEDLEELYNAVTSEDLKKHHEALRHIIVTFNGDLHKKKKGN